MVGNSSGMRPQSTYTAREAPLRTQSHKGAKARTRTLSLLLLDLTPTAGRPHQSNWQETSAKLVLRAKVPQKTTQQANKQTKGRRGNLRSQEVSIPTRRLVWD